MKAKELNLLFYKQIIEQAQNNEVHYVGKSDHMAMLFGTDEVVLDVQRKLIKFPGMGSVDCEDIEPEINPDWYALYQENGSDDWIVMLGYGDPYGKEYIDILPSLNGEILATPSNLTISMVKSRNRSQRRKSKR